MVLATDMKQHFALCSQFSTVHRLSAFSAERAKAAAAPMDQAAAGAPPRPSPRGNVLPRYVTYERWPRDLLPLEPPPHHVRGIGTGPGSRVLL